MEPGMLQSLFLTFSIFVFCGISASSGAGPPYIVDSNKSHSQGTNARYCPNNCVCKGLGYVTRVYCFNVTSVPLDIPRRVKKLDLRKNQLSVLKEGAFAVYQHLEELFLADNLLEELRPGTFSGLRALQVLNLNDNNLRLVPSEALMKIEQLRELNLEGNKMPCIWKDDFNGLPNLKVLTLSRNQLQIIPGEALEALPNLEFLDLAENNISEIGEGLFPDLENLQGLNLGGNKIANITTNAFFGLTALQVLELQHNVLKDIPHAISDLPSLKKLSVAFNNIPAVKDGIFYNNPSLAHVDLLGNPVRFIERHVFTNLTQLKILIIPEAKELNTFPDLNGTLSLEFLRIDRTQIQHIPNDICQISSKLKTLDLKSNALDKVPLLSSCKELRQLQLSGNQITSLEGSLFSQQGMLHDLLLNNNLIEMINQHAFLGLGQLEILNLRGNRICYIHNDAFLPLKQLIYLNVAENKFSFLPSHGLEHVSQLLTFDNPLLRDFPPPSSLPHVHTLKLSYAYHCCQFMVSMNTQESAKKVGSTTNLQETVVWLPKEKVDLSLWSGNTSDLWPVYQNLTHKFGDLAEDLFGNLNPDYVYPYNLPQMVEDYIEEARSHDYLRLGHLIHCSPQPGPFMPCKDLFDWWTLRCGVWIVFLLSMIGNGAVVFVIIFSRTKMDVPRFLVCNLACADFCMGVYLAFLAVIDASTLGQFKMFALQWQFSPGCQIAGFLGVLSSELSVYTLAVITLERNYAITNAMHLNKRLSITHAGYIMACGWMFSIFTASLPFFGISDYRKFAVCLPFDIETPSSLAYVVFLMAVNGLAFLILIGCYLKMYCAIRGSQAWNSNDSRIAKRMALLVFTDFVCWAPIAFFSLTAAFGLQLVTLEEAKVFTIFVLPLNSCANPFLYAILTKQFKKDCILICKSIEESRVTRGIGRCRHSSNFSNRQTPANTNSALERNSNNGHVICSCSQGSSDAGAGRTTSTTQDFLPTPLQHRWQLFKLRFLLCLSVDETEPYPSNEYAYAIAEIQKNQQRHSRNLSLSSDNFSTSRSDSWRQKSIPLRMLEKNRRSSWTITRKPSQDSNLSSSRNDSSSNTPSTSTWRVSRSSVSSDMSGNSHQQRCNLGNIRERMSSATSGAPQENCLGMHSFPHNSHNAGDANHPSRDAVGNLVPISDNIKNEGCINHALPTSARPKVKLKRQSAVMEEIIIPQTLHTIPSDDNGKSTNENSLDSGDELVTVSTSEQIKSQPMEQVSKEMQNTTSVDILSRYSAQNLSLKSRADGEKLEKTSSSVYLRKENPKFASSRQTSSILTKKRKDNIEHPTCIRLSRTSSLTNVRESNASQFGKTFTNTSSSQNVTNAAVQNTTQDSKQLCQTHLSQSDNILIKQLPRSSFQDLNKNELYQELSRINLLMDYQEDGALLLSKANFQS